MKTLKFRKLNLLHILLCAFLLGSCAYRDKYDKEIVKSTKTGKYYLLRHNVGDTYHITELDSCAFK